MSITANKELIRRYQDAYNRNDLGAVKACIGGKFVAHNNLPGVPEGIEGGNIVHQMTVASFPDLRVRIDDMVADRDKVAVRWTLTGTHTGQPFLGQIPTSGNKTLMAGQSLFRIADDKIVEHWGQEDAVGWMAQMTGQAPTAPDYAIKAPQTKGSASPDQARRVVQETMKLLDARNLDRVVSMMSDDFIAYGWAQEPIGRDAYRQFMAAVLEAYPDSRFPVYDVVTEGNKVAVRHALEGTHNGTLQTPGGPVPPTGKKVHVDAIVTLEVDGSKTCRGWLTADIFGMLVQLGVIQIPGS